MKRCFIHVDSSHSVKQVLQLTQFARIRHILILDEGLLVGTVSHRDLAGGDRVFAGTGRDGADLSAVPISRVMRAPVATVTAQDSLEAAALLMHRQGVGCLPVVECAGSLHVIGLITESDLLAAAYCAIAAVYEDPTARSRSVERAA